MSDKKQNDNSKHTTQFAELRKKYTIDVKSAFPVTAAAYNKTEIEKQKREDTLSNRLAADRREILMMY